LFADPILIFLLTKQLLPPEREWARLHRVSRTSS